MDAVRAELLAIVEVDFSDRVRCQQPGCNHVVYRAVHMVREPDGLLILGSTCFARRYGIGAPLGPPKYSTNSGRTLTPEERALLVSNTDQLLQNFERQLQERAAMLRRQSDLKRLLVPAGPPRPAISAPKMSLASFGVRPQIKGVPPWPWMKPKTSLAYFLLQNGQGWVRVQHVAGHQMLAPWPPFSGWDDGEVACLGRVDFQAGAIALTDVVPAIDYLRRHSVKSLVTGLWSEIAALAG